MASNETKKETGRTYECCVHVEMEGSQEIRRILKEAGFDVRLFNTFCGRFVAEPTATPADDNIVAFRREPLSYYCIYNDNKGPSEELLKKIEESPSVTFFSLTLRKRRK